MDQDRQLRFLIPPFFLYASLLGALWSDPVMRCKIMALIKLGTLKDFLPLATAAAVVILPLGFMIGTFTILLLRAIFWIGWKRWGEARQSYEAWLSPMCFDRINRICGLNPPLGRRFLVQLASTFDHEIIDKGVHEWLLRRWNAFNICISSAVSLVAICLSCHLFGISPSNEWWWAVSGLVAILLLQGIFAWRDAMRMIEFQSIRATMKLRILRSSSARPASGCR